jgi:hypothetical protein
VSESGAQRASRQRSLNLVLLSLLAAAVSFGGLIASPAPAAAAGPKVVVVVGPVGSSTAGYIETAKGIAAHARSLGASVTEVYSPNATWSRVKTVAQGAKVLVYLGHGNGYPSPYGSFQPYTKDGMGLNATAGNGNSNVKYWGEYYIDRYITLAPNAVVILNRLCYASGNSEWGAANPTKSTAIKRVDNYGAGFLRANAKAVFAEGITSPKYILTNLFRTNRSLKQIFWAAPQATGDYWITFHSARTSGRTAILDPYAPSRYYRSVIGNLNVTAAQWRG